MYMCIKLFGFIFDVKMPINHMINLKVLIDGKIVNLKTRVYLLSISNKALQSIPNEINTSHAYITKHHSKKKNTEQ